MKQFILHIVFSIPLILAINGCAKEASDIPETPRELSIPEKVEADLLEIASHDWLSLKDTLVYFNNNFIKNGKTKGYGPDKVYYELNTSKTTKGVKMEFIVQDSVFVTAHGYIDPVSLQANAFNTDFTLETAESDSLSIKANTINVIAPRSFGSDPDATASLLFEGERVGYLTRETFENEDYTTSSHIVVHYYNDTRTFAFYGR